MPPLELHPSAYRATPGNLEYDELFKKFSNGEMQMVDLGEETLFFRDGEDLELALPAYSMETGKVMYVTGTEGRWRAPNAQQRKPKQGWLNKILRK